MRRRINKERLRDSLATLHEKFEHEGIVYRFDARPVFKVIDGVRREVTSRVSAFFIPLALRVATGASLATAWPAWSEAQEHFWKLHHFGLLRWLFENLPGTN